LAASRSGLSRTGADGERFFVRSSHRHQEPLVAGNGNIPSTITTASRTPRITGQRGSRSRPVECGTATSLTDDPRRPRNSIVHVLGEGVPDRTGRRSCYKTRTRLPHYSPACLLKGSGMNFSGGFSSSRWINTGQAHPTPINYGVSPATPIEKNNWSLVSRM